MDTRTPIFILAGALDHQVCKAIAVGNVYTLVADAEDSDELYANLINIAKHFLQADMEIFGIVTPAGICARNPDIAYFKTPHGRCESFQTALENLHFNLIKPTDVPVSLLC